MCPAPPAIEQCNGQVLSDSYSIPSTVTNKFIEDTSTVSAQLMKSELESMIAQAPDNVRPVKHDILL